MRSGIILDFSQHLFNVWLNKRQLDPPRGLRMRSVAAWMGGPRKGGNPRLTHDVAGGDKKTFLP